jgi:hypothetical protein
MWGNSKPAEYLSFRVFIFGITSQSMFPNGVIYEGCEDDKPLNFRGESGANDSIVCRIAYLNIPNITTDVDFCRSPCSTTSAKSPCPLRL